MCQLDYDLLVVKVELICLHDIVYGFLLNFKTGELKDLSESVIKLDETTTMITSPSTKLDESKNILAVAHHHGIIKIWDVKTYKNIYKNKFNAIGRFFNMLMTSGNLLIVTGTSINAPKDIIVSINTKTNEFKQISKDNAYSPILVGDFLVFIETPRYDRNHGCRFKWWTAEI
jgi:hypothetical protein